MPTSPISTAQPVLPPEQQVPLLPLNAGGQAIDLPQAAVDAFPDSDLARWAHGALLRPCDEAGRLFIDRDPRNVATLTDYLRGGQELSTLDADHLAALAAESRALHMGAGLDDTLEWERLRRQVGELSVERLMQGRPESAGLGDLADDAATVRAWLRFQDLSAARGEPVDRHAPEVVGGMHAREVRAHYAPLLAADPNHGRALLFLSNCAELSQAQRLAHARQLYDQHGWDPVAQLNLMQVFLHCLETDLRSASHAAPGTAAPTSRDDAGLELARLLRELPGDDVGDTHDRLALAKRLESTPWSTLLAEFAEPRNADAALSTGLLLRRLQSQHRALQPDQPSAQLQNALEPLVVFAGTLLAERLLRLPKGSEAEAPAEWWATRLMHRHGKVIQRYRLLSEESNPPPRDADVAFLQAGYEELWTAYARNQDPAYLAALADNLASEGEPEVRNLIAAQKARLRAAAALHEPQEAQVAWVLQRLGAPDA